MSLRTEYDVWHGKYHELNTSYDDTSSPWYRWVADSMGDVSGLRTLEVACGRGGFVRKLARSSKLSCGLDFSGSAIAIARNRWRELDRGSPTGLVQGDAQALPFPDGTFDVLVSCETIEHLPSPLVALREFRRVTCPSGLLYLTTPNYFNFMGLYEIYAKFRHPSRVPDQPYDRVQLFFQTRSLLKEAGWRILLSDGTVHQFPVFPGRNPVRVQALEANVRLRKLLSIFAYTYCLIAQNPA